jgi:hypothetical protein
MANKRYDKNTGYSDEQLRDDLNITGKLKKTISKLGDNEEPVTIHDLETVNVSLEEYKEFLKYDFRSFALLFLHEEEGIEHGIPDFHVFGLKRMTSEDIVNLVIAWPRDHAKTTLLKIAIIWLFIHTNFRFAMYVCHTNRKAANALSDIATKMTRASVVEVYGKPSFYYKRESTGNYKLQWVGKTIIMEAVGVGQDVRGTNIDSKRPDILALDDVEKAEEGEENKMGYEGISDWFYGTLRKCVDRRKHKIIQIGNLVAEKSLLYDNLTSKYWTSTRLAAITKDGKPLWPARWTLASLKLDLLEYMEKGKMGIWMSEMLNMPVNESNSIIRSNNVELVDSVTPDDEEILLRCITVDPAITTSATHADNAVVFVHVYKRGAWQPAEIWSAKGQSVYDLYYKIMELAAKWRVLTVGIECEGYQEALLQVCEQMCIEKRITHMNFVPVKTGKKSKASRIIAFAGMFKEGLYKLSYEYLWLLESLMKYDPNTKNNKDDEIDCGAYILKMIDQYGNLLLGQKRKSEKEVDEKEHGHLKSHVDKVYAHN